MAIDNFCFCSCFAVRDIIENFLNFGNRTKVADPLPFEAKNVPSKGAGVGGLDCLMLFLKCFHHRIAINMAENNQRKK